MLTNEISGKDLKIHVHHVGGIGDCGPTEAIRMLGNDVEWTVYDADESALSKMNELGGGTLLVNKCIGGSNSKNKFHIMRGQSASSLLIGSPEARDYTLITDPGKAQVWGIHTQVIRSIDIELNTIDSLVMSKQIHSIDFLSIDAQGAELDIINGASQVLSDTIIGVLCEVEFSEIYANQPLFCDIQSRLRKENFRLCQIYNNQNWNIYPFQKGLMGEGFNIVGEALFLKNHDAMVGHDSISKVSRDILKAYAVKCLKLAAIAVVFDQLDVALKIIKTLQDCRLISLDTLANKVDVMYIKLLSDLTNTAKDIERSKPPLEYQSSYSLDYKINTHRRLVELYCRIWHFLKIIMPPFAMYCIRKITYNALKEYSTITKIYRKYGLNVLIKRQSCRLWWK